MLSSRRKLKGCEEKVSHVVGKTQDISFNLCPGNFWSSASLGFLEMHSAFEHGVLPFPGALADQPAKIMDIFRVIQSHKHEKMLEDINREKMKARTQTRGRNHQNLGRV